MSDQKQKPKVELYSGKYFALCSLGGILSCGLTHTFVTPIDLVKCNKQNNPKLFPSGMFGNMAIIMKHKGPAGLFKGWGPTLVGYSLQGMAKFGLYEVFKHKYGQMVGEENAYKYKVLLYCCASASAEFFADMLLCPLETVKLKVQTVGIDQWLKGEGHGYARGGLDGFPKLLAAEGWGGAFKIISPLWARQIPYTVIKFVAFEAIIEQIYKYTTKNWNRPKASYNKVEQLGFTFLAGYTAGVICGAVSHPADMMASLMSKNPDMPGGALTKISTLYSKGYKDTPATGFNGLWKGFGPRVFMIGTLTGLQWFIYDTVKVSFGIPTTGAVGEPPKNKH
jgi:solute carrier family 25 phosphate transporter 3